MPRTNDERKFTTQVLCRIRGTLSREIAGNYRVHSYPIVYKSAQSVILLPVSPHSLRGGTGGLRLKVKQPKGPRCRDYSCPDCEGSVTDQSSN